MSLPQVDNPPLVVGRFLAYAVAVMLKFMLMVFA